METKQDIDQFLTLQKKTLSELKAICEGLKLGTTGTKSQLIDRLIYSQVVPQISVVKPQTIPLRSRDHKSQQIDSAYKALQKWRTQIFWGKNNRKIFDLINAKGKIYQKEMKYMKCPNKTLDHIISHQWYLPVQQNKNLVEMLKNHPEKFDINIVQKSDNHGSSWLMLHIAPKK